MTNSEYGIRRTDLPDEEILWPDSDGEVFLKAYLGDGFRTEGIGYTNAEDLSTLLRNVAAHNANPNYTSKFEVLERHYSEPVVIDSVPLPTAPGSVVRKNGVLYALSDDDDGFDWIGLSSDSVEAWVSAVDLKGAEVLFIPSEA